MEVDVEFYRENVVYRSLADHTVNFAVEGPANEFAGFRKPQRAAAFAVFSHLDSDPDVPAIVVMPTGTGKTDTIFAIIVSGRFQRTLIIGACPRFCVNGSPAGDCRQTRRHHESTQARCTRRAA